MVVDNIEPYLKYLSLNEIYIFLPIYLLTGFK